MPEALTYRLFEERDLPSLLRLWEEAGWGVLTEQQWREWYVETPHGACLISVGVDDEGEIAAQEIFTPARLVVDEREVRALRLSVPILRKGFRRKSLRSPDHPVINLYLTGIEAAAAQGYGVVYALPEHGWLPFFRWGPRSGVPNFFFVNAEFDCLARPVGLGGCAPEKSDHFYARPANDFNGEYEVLWEAALKEFPLACGVRRDAAWLRFRNGGRIAVEVRDGRDDSLAGYAAIRKKDGLVADFLARHPRDVSSVLAATVNLVAESQNNLSSPLETLKLMRTPLISAAAQQLGFMPTDYKFAFVCKSLDDSVGTEAIAAERWHIMPGD